MSTSRRKRSLRDAFGTGFGVSSRAKGVPGDRVPYNRYVLVHCHIYKNAGTSVDRLLKENFGNRWVDFENTQRGEPPRSNDLVDFVRDHPSIVAVSSHSSYLVWPELFANALPVVFLRHPIDRALSVYNFARRDPTTPDHIHACDGLQNYVTWALRSQDGGVVVRNYQVCHLSEAPIRAGHAWHAQATASDLRHARSLLTTWPAFGLVRRFEESVRRFQSLYAAFLPGLNLRSVHENASTAGFVTEQDAISSVRDALGGPLFDDLCGANELDLELYHFATELFAMRDPALPASTPARQ